jgi:hypothetical protein
MAPRLPCVVCASRADEVSRAVLTIDTSNNAGWDEQVEGALLRREVHSRAGRLQYVLMFRNRMPNHQKSRAHVDTTIVVAPSRFCVLPGTPTLKSFPMDICMMGIR